MGSPSRVIHKTEFRAAAKNTVYVGRKSPYWAPQLSSDKYRIEDIKALHRLFLYENFISDSKSFSLFKKTFSSKTLLCDCEDNLRGSKCPAYNYIHVLNNEFKSRTYKDSLLHYCMSDLRRSLEHAFKKINIMESNGDWIYIYFAYSELKLSLAEIFDFCKARKINFYTVAKLILLVTIDVESFCEETNVSMMKYHLNHADWMAVYFFSGFKDRRDEPIRPLLEAT